MLAGLAALVVGWLLRLAWQQPVVGTVLLVLGIAALAWALLLGGRQHPHTVYRPDRWARGDYVVVGGALLTTLVYLVPWPGLDQSTLFYYPYPALTWPTISWPIAAATLGLAMPIVVGL